MDRRHFLRRASVGTTVLALGGVYALTGRSAAAAGLRADGRPRVPPGQREISKLKAMGGSEGDPSKSKYRLRISGEVQTPLELGFRDLVKMTQTTARADVHCVTGWSLLDAEWTGIQVQKLAEMAGVLGSARYVIFEAAHGYTANVALKDALASKSMIAHKLDGVSLANQHGAPVRAVIPDLYFWKSAKWLTGIRFVRRDEPGYWETRGYHNHADPWTEERFA